MMEASLLMGRLEFRYTLFRRCTVCFLEILEGVLVPPGTGLPVILGHTFFCSVNGTSSLTLRREFTHQAEQQRVWPNKGTMGTILSPKKAMRYSYDQLAVR